MASEVSGGQGGEFVELPHFTIDERSVRLLEYDFCLEHQVVVLGKAGPVGGLVTVGMLHPARRSLVSRLSATLGRQVQPVRLSPWEIRRALDQGYGRLDEERRDVLLLRPIQDFSFRADAEAPELLDEILGHAAQLGAGDVHIETYDQDVDVRFRIDGVLHQVATPLSPATVQAALTRLKVLANLDIAERRRAQDGRVRAVYEEPDGRSRTLDFRLSVVPGPFGEDAVLRVLDGSAPMLGLERLGFTDSTRATFERMIENPEGLILVTGPTGSGKTTTLYSAIDRISSPTRKILTVEDPIEYYFPKTNQKQVSVTMGFADYGRAFMRQNPDVILIGEIRDEETASVALRAAQTGHLVLSTLHTTDSVRMVSRLHTLGIDLDLMAGSLLGAISQRLLRRLCPHCRRETPATEAESRRLRLGAGEGPFFTPAGCEACGGRGYKGRIGVYELFAMDAELADLVAERAPVHRLRAKAIERGMRTLLEDALDKARAGITSLAEVVRAVPYRLIEEDRPSI
ncbi:MAG TPA: GspE/PulE family protein [Thermoanaerobaculia bacterium]|nr:GspE/PulE family protein [Thermoanaerobaculia bacterium]